VFCSHSGGQTVEVWYSSLAALYIVHVGLSDFTF